MAKFKNMDELREAHAAEYGTPYNAANTKRIISILNSEGKLETIEIPTQEEILAESFKANQQYKLADNLLVIAMWLIVLAMLIIRINYDGSIM